MISILRHLLVIMVTILSRYFDFESLGVIIRIIINCDVDDKYYKTVIIMVTILRRYFDFESLEADLDVMYIYEMLRII